LAALAFAFISCGRKPYGTIIHRREDGRPDKWENQIDPNNYEIAIDTNGDGVPDLTKIYKDNELLRIERDRNFDGKIDLVQEFSQGVLVREIHDDNFDGKPELIKTFRPDGSLAIVERDPTERGAIDIMEFYDTSGRLISRELRSGKKR
jgi:hypothetical protein